MFFGDLLVFSSLQDIDHPVSFREDLIFKIEYLTTKFLLFFGERLDFLLEFELVARILRFFCLSSVLFDFCFCILECYFERFGMIISPFFQFFGLFLEVDSISFVSSFEELLPFFIIGFSDSFFEGILT
jgi:hypothetical protein